MIPRRAFTLMEVLLALVIVVGFVGAMFGLYWHGLDVRDQTHALLDEVTAQRLLLRQICGELETAMVYPFLQFGLSGQAEQAEWITCRLPGPGAWIPADVMEAPRVPESDIQIVGYRLRMGEDENGEPVVQGVERTLQTVLAPEITEEGEGEDSAAVQVRLMTSQVRLLRFEYYDGTTWSEAWSQTDLPRAVKVTLGADAFDPERPLTEYTGETMSRIVCISGSRVQGESAAQDPDAEAGL